MVPRKVWTPTTVGRGVKLVFRRASRGKGNDGGASGWVGLGYVLQCAKTRAKAVVCRVRRKGVQGQCRNQKSMYKGGRWGFSE